MTDWYKDTLQPASVSITFQNTDNVSKPVTFARSGADANYFNLAPTSIVVPANGNNQLLLLYSIPSTATVGIHQGYITGDFLPSGVIPIIMNVMENTTTTTTNTGITPCKIIARPSGLYKSIYKDAIPSPEEIEVRLTSGCIGGVDLSVELTGDIIDTIQGRQPARIKRETLGYIEYGTSGNFIIEFDISEVESRTYNIRAKVSGMYGDEVLSTEIPVVVTALAPGSPFYANTSSSVEPDYVVPAQVEEDTKFQIEIRNINPNLYTEIEIPDSVVPVGSDSTSGKLIYSLKSVGREAIIIQIKMKDKNTHLQMFPTKRFKISVVESGAIQRGSYLKFIFFPSLNDLIDGSSLNIQTRDNLTNNIIESVIYVNGKVIADNTITVSSGETYVLSAVSENYNTVDKTFSIQQKALKITVVPSNPEVYDQITIVVKDNVTGTDVESTIILDGMTLQTKNTQIRSAGNHTVYAEADGYIADTTQFVASSGAMLSYAPTTIELNQTATFTFNKDSDYSVVYKELPNSTGHQLRQGTGKQVSFRPTKVGYYSIYLKDIRVREYVIEEPDEIDTPFTFDWRLIPIILVILLVIGFLLKNKQNFNKPRKAGYPDSILRDV